MPIKVNLDPLESAEKLPYLGRTITYNNSKWEDLYNNLRKAQRRWGMVLRVLVKAGATVRARVTMHREAVQMVLLYRSESWFIMDEMMKVSQ